VIGTNGTTREPSLERIHDVERITAALRMAMREALRVHKRLGNPIAVWRDGQVVWLAPEDIPVDVNATEPPIRPVGERPPAS